MSRAAHLAVLALVCASTLAASVRRVVIIKLDGVPADLIEQVMHESDPATGKTRLPWLRHIFLEGGTRVSNFYTRGLSLSAPSWSILDTGRHLRIHGNAEFDRYTLRTYDYLNFFPFYVNYARSKRVDMPAVELLDELGIPMLIDRFRPDERRQSLQLFQRGVRWRTLRSLLGRRFIRPLPQMIDDWETGFEGAAAMAEQMESELVAALSDPDIRYLDLFSGDYDHVAHRNNDPFAQREVLGRVDAMIGRIWERIAASGLAADTMLVVLSDHGLNSDPRVFSQGFNLVRLFGSAAGGGHHVVTNRIVLGDYKVRGLDPFVSRVVTPSDYATYLHGQAEQYPTVALDLDGNERAAVQLRNSTLNELHILLSQLADPALDGSRRRAAQDAVERIVVENRTSWSRTIAELTAELDAMKADIARRDRELKPGNRRGSVERRRMLRRLAIDREDERSYRDWVRIMNNLLAVEPRSLEPGKFRIEDLVPRRSFGDANTVNQIRHYVVGAGPNGLVEAAPGVLDFERSFQRLDYLALLRAQRVRNNPQPGLSPEPIDFIAVPAPDGVLLYNGDDTQAMLEWRDGMLRYRPVAGEWRPGLPLHIFEDPEFAVPEGERPAWLADWHAEREWFEAVHRTRYSNAVIGLYEHFRAPTPARRDDLLERFREHRRALLRSDMLVLANDHWNFNVRGFNSGGNHGSFFRVSTHSVLMFAGGANTGIPAGLVIDRPYDSLNFAPTILKLMGLSCDGLDGEPIEFTLAPVTAAPPAKTLPPSAPNSPATDVGSGFRQ